MIDPDNEKIYARRGPLIDLRRCVSERFFWKYCSEAQGYTASHIDKLQKEVDTIPQAIVKKMTSIGTSFLFGTKEEAFRSLIRLIEFADSYFKQYLYETAILDYRTALAHLDVIKQHNNEFQVRSRALRASLHARLSDCYYQKKDFLNCLSYCKSSLNLNPVNDKIRKRLNFIQDKFAVMDQKVQQDVQQNVKEKMDSVRDLHFKVLRYEREVAELKKIGGDDMIIIKMTE